MRTLIIDNFSNDYGEDYINLIIVDETGVVPVKDEHKDRVCILVGPNEYRVDDRINSVADYILNEDEYDDDIKRFVSLERKRKRLLEKMSDLSYDNESFKQSEEYENMNYEIDSLFDEAYNMPCATRKLKDVLVWKGIGRDEFCKLYNIGTIVVAGYDIEFDNNPKRRYRLSPGDVNEKHTFGKNQIIKL